MFSVITNIYNKKTARRVVGAEGYVSGLQDAAASCKPDT